MPEWFREAFRYDTEFPLIVLAVRLTAALVLGCVVAGVYRLTHGKSNGDSLSLMATLVMLTVLIATVTLVIGENTARAFSLVGALAIIRFRTIVEDTRDTAFVIFAVAVGMAVGAGFLLIALICIPAAAIAAMVFRPRRRLDPLASGDFLLTVRVGVGHHPESLLQTCFGRHLCSSRLVTTTTARQGAALELIYQVRLQREDSAIALVEELNKVEGIQNVDLRRS
jgi:hypothetical protein